MKGADHMAELHDDWKDSSDPEDFLLDNLSEEGGVIIDFGDIRTDDEAQRECILDNGLQSAAVMGLNNNDSFVSGTSDSSDPPPKHTAASLLSPASALTNNTSLPSTMDQMFDRLLDDPESFSRLQKTFLSTGSAHGTGAENEFPRRRLWTDKPQGGETRMGGHPSP